MDFSTTELEQQLLESAAGRAVYDSLVQANIDVRSVSLETVKQMLMAECRHRRQESEHRYRDQVVAC